MASSGSFNTDKINVSSTVGDRYLTFSWSVKEQDIATNKTVISWTLKGAGGDSAYYYMAGNFKVVIDGDTVYSSSTRIKLYGNTTVASGTKTLYHATDGTREFSASAEAGIYNVAVNSEGDDSWSLPTIARHGTSTQSLNSKTETTIKMNWSSDNTVDYIWYSKDNGSNWTGVNVTDGKSGTYTISGLSANTTYKIKTRIRRKDSQLTTDSSALSVTTYDYPYCTESPNFILGDMLVLKFYNPLSRAFKFYIIGNGTQIDVEYNCSSTIYSGVNSTTTSVPYLYATIPNAKSGKYQVKVVYGTSTKTRNSGNTYSIKEANCYPTFTTFTYKDTNTTVTAVTGNDQALVKGKSTLEVYVDSADKMTTKNSATPKRYNASIDTVSKNVDYATSDITIKVGTVSASGTRRLTVRAYDSRELSTPAHKDVTVYDYKEPVINVSAKRLNNFEAQTTLSVNGTYSRLTIGGVDKNTITAVEYHYRETGGTWSEWTTLTTTLTSGKFTCNDVVLTLDNQKSFEFEIKATDKLSSPIKTATVDVGQAIFFISTDKKSCYINGEQVPTFESVYPIGSVYCNSTNANPSEIYGGTWELIDKGFKTETTEIKQEATEYLSSFTVVSIRTERTVRLRIALTTAKDIADTTVTLGTVDLQAHGLVANNESYFLYGVFGGVAMSDGGNTIVTYDLKNTGVLESNDCQNIDGTHTLYAGSSFYIDAVVITSQSRMNDDFCDKFYWKRTA